MMGLWRIRIVWAKDFGKGSRNGAAATVEALRWEGDQQWRGGIQEDGRAYGWLRREGLKKGCVHL